MKFTRLIMLKKASVFVIKVSLGIINRMVICLRVQSYIMFCGTSCVESCESVTPSHRKVQYIL